MLEGIVCQALLPKASGQGRVAALEILVATPAIRNLIRDDKIHQIYGTMQAGQEKLGMQTMNQSLARLVERRIITRDAALATSSNRDELITILERGARGRVAGRRSAGARSDARCAGGGTMTTYAWVGRTRNGQIVKGERAAESTEALTRRAPARADPRHEGRPGGQEGRALPARVRRAAWPSSRASSPS